MKTKKLPRINKYLFMHADLFGSVIKGFETIADLKKYKRLHYHGDDYRIYKAKDGGIVKCDMRG